MAFSSETERDISREYYQGIYAILDEVRLGLLNGKKLDEEAYDRYLDGMLANIPDAYRQFFLDMSDVDGSKTIIRRV